ncbi:SWIM zinc finger [Paenibacillus sophorae]|uniref:SWIM zinc finger n=1 Tax=Paenibacillus sophorae TaxID=1333845 RepID=A0A1H8PA72_9BACL|nr:SWIM zinc finger family protein [Paenibacillus sophorae]QWU16498.1 SWIM zinc finger family protein [Paenibacillus sophorae]SEO38822.1 SWIM zinc finger [Paenibacillus sophorae]
MPSIPALDDAGWARLIQDTAYYFDDLTLKKGFQYYKQNRVIGLTAGSPGLVTAFVDGKERYSVEIVLGALSISSCSCPVLGPCKHMAAVLMDYAGAQSRPVQLLANAKSSAQVRAAMSSARAVPEGGKAAGSRPSGLRHDNSAAGTLAAGNSEPGSGGGAESSNGTDADDRVESYPDGGEAGYAGGSGSSGRMDNRPGGADRSSVRPGSTGAKGGALRGSQDALKEQGRLIPVMNVAEWHELFARCVSPLAGDTRNPQYADEAIAAILRIKPPMAPELEKLFGLHTRLFVLETLTARVVGRTGTFTPSLGYYTHLAVTELQDDIERFFSTKPSPASEPEQWNRILDTLGVLRRALLAESKEQTFYSALYYLLWRKWIIPEMRDTALFEEELRRLEGEEDNRAASPSRQPLLIARAWMHFCLSEDDEALSLLREAAKRPGFHPEGLDIFWEPLSEAGEARRLVSWLTEAGELLRGHRRHGLDSYARHWEEAVRLLPGAEPQMWRLLADMLPLSGDIYEEKLLAHGRWRQWMDYQLSSGKDPADFRVRELQPLEKNAPELLLPFYHQAVERHVSEKNRSSYKAAVKLLKRLSKLYKKMKAEDRFEHFLGSFTARHSRLRALQEELRKGKLTP